MLKFEYGKWFFGWTWNDDWCWFYPFNYLVNEPKVRYLGYNYDWYDGPLYSIGFWFFNISWRF